MATARDIRLRQWELAVSLAVGTVHQEVLFAARQGYEPQDTFASMVTSVANKVYPILAAGPPGTAQPTVEGPAPEGG